MSLSSLTQRLKQHFGSWKIIFNYVVNDIEKRPRAFKIGVFSIFIVVCFLVILQTALYLTPVIFIRLAEDQNGQYDLTITPVAAERDSRTVTLESASIPVIRAVNLTELEQKIGDMPEIAGMSPRWLLPVRLANPKHPDQSFQAVAIIVDSERERKYGIGKNLQVPDLHERECWISKTAQRLLKIQDGQILLSLDIFGALSKLQTLTIGGENTFSKDELNSVVLDFLQKNIGPSYKINIEEDLEQLTGFSSVTLRASISLVRLALTAATKSDGTLNLQLLNTLLVASGVLPADQPLPLDAIGDIPSSAVIALLDTTETILDEGSIELNATLIAQTLLPVFINSLDIRQQFKIISVVEKPRGKWPEELGNVIVLDSKYIVDIFSRNFLQVLRTTKLATGNPVFDSFLSNFLQRTQVENYVSRASQGFDINEYSLTVNLLLNNRAEIYASMESVRPHMIKVTNEIYTRLGRDHPTTISSSLDLIISGLFIFKSLLDNVFNATVFILLLLSVLLIYSLMHSNVEEKTYEFGMLRALGMKQNSLMTLLGLQSAFFAFPGLLLGLILAYAVNTAISYFIFNYTSIAVSYQLPTPALVTGICVAVFVPFASNIIPIRRALSKTLKDSLNIYHRVVSDMTVRILRLAQLGISPAQTVGALTLTIMGIITYDVAPYTFVFAKISLFFLIITAVLLMMILGFTILLNLLQSPSERGILKLIMLLFPQDKQLETVVLKNLGAHKNRNTKTSLMFSIALSFLIFAGTSFRLNSSLLVDQLKAGLGADIVIKSLPIERTVLKEAEIREALGQYTQSFPDVIKSFAFVSMPMGKQPAIPWSRLTTLAGTPVGAVEIVSVDADYLKAAYDDYYLPVNYDSSVKVDYLPDSGQPDGVQALYKPEGLEILSAYDEFGITSNAEYRDSTELNSYIGEKEVRILLSSGLALQLSVDVGTPSLLTFGDKVFRARVRNSATKFPGFFFTGYRTLYRATVITSHEDYQYITNHLHTHADYFSRDAIKKFQESIPENSSYGVPKHNLLIKLKSGVDREARLNLFNTLQTLVDGQFSFVVDVVETANSTKENLVFIDLFFVLVSIIAISLSFFFTVVSFVSNISENLWEFGVLRAVGLSKNQMTKVYVFEALSIVVSAGILGTLVGIIVALATTIQFNLFTELPFRFLFPTAVFLFTLIISMMTAIFGSKAAVDDVKNRQISSIIKALE